MPPFVKVDGADQIRGLNKVGMSPAPAYRPKTSAALEAAYRSLFSRKKPISVAMAEFDTTTASTRTSNKWSVSAAGIPVGMEDISKRAGPGSSLLYHGLVGSERCEMPGGQSRSAPVGR